ncbi:PmoA family protein [Polymorphospora sp. NPDC050346]|uniref:DUF6807 domain-containing protein n=1 Tax=Polymorphospora sp. NPDC050346 TaxID=3155780 RepID=UPI0033E1E3F4
MTDHPDPVRLQVRGSTVADYVLAPDIDPRWSPRPHLHPVRTLAGVPVTDTLPEDHRWHLGVSVAMQDVSGTNLWGGRTYVRDAGYTWLDDHGRIVHDTWHERRPDGFAQRLRWLDPAGDTLLVEERTVAVSEIGHAGTYALDIAYTLTAPAGRDISLGSPATNGRPGGAGYGGFFWRIAPGTPQTFTAGADGEETVNGSTEPWLALTGRGADGAPYSLVFAGLGDGDHWFVRTGIYPGVCVALAFESTLPVPAGGAVSRHHRILVADGTLTRDQVHDLPLTPSSR